jgi:glycine/D-amino acid oxidase-like deaminating enzyme
MTPARGGPQPDRPGTPPERSRRSGAPAAERYDAAVVGAGFFGVRLALLLARRGARVALIERGPGILGRASGTNQARVHNGYHYPRSLSTAHGAHRHYERFLRELAGCVDKAGAAHLYAVARAGSATSAAQFERFCRGLGLPLAPAPPRLAGLFDRDRVEAVFAVREASFDAASVRRRLEADLAAAAPRVEPMPGVEALRLELGGRVAVVATDAGPVRARSVFVVAYAGTNGLLLASGLPPLEAKAELAEVCLVEPPPELRGLAVTVVDGPFFSLTPLPGQGAHALTHVRYTPHATWDLARPTGAPPYAPADTPPPATRFPFMRKDALRYLPAAAGLRLLRSRFELKAIPSRREVDDGRPVLVRRLCDDPLCVAVLGSKFDSVFELEEAVEAMLECR